MAGRHVWTCEVCDLAPIMSIKLIRTTKAGVRQFAHFDSPPPAVVLNLWVCLQNLGGTVWAIWIADSRVLLSQVPRFDCQHMLATGER